MKTTKKRNKKYSPREIFTNAVDWAIAGSFTFPHATQAEITLPVYDAFKIMQQGIATRDDWNMVCSGANLAEALAGLQIGPNLLPAIYAGLDALDKVARRMLKGGTSTMRADEMAAIREMIEMYRIQVSLCTQAEFGRAIKKVKDMHRGGAMKEVAKVYAAMN